MAVVIERVTQRGPAKPLYGAACNGCGLCCMAELCPLGTAVFEKLEGPCPALEHDDGRFQCGLVRNPTKYARPWVTQSSGSEGLAEAAAVLIGAGSGCDARLDGEPDDPAWRDHVYAAASQPDRRMRALGMLARWLGLKAQA